MSNLPQIFNNPKFGEIRTIEIEGKIKKGMIGFGQPYEMNTLHKGIAEINILGKIIAMHNTW